MVLVFIFFSYVMSLTEVTAHISVITLQQFYLKLRNITVWDIRGYQVNRVFSNNDIL